MADENMRVEFEHKAFIGEGESGFVLVIRMKKDDFETAIEIPVGDEVSSKDFALAARALFQAATVFHHQMYDRLREKLEEFNRGFEKSRALLEKK